MWNRREVMARIARGFTSAGFATAVLAAEPWTSDSIIEAPELAKRLESGSAPLIICVAFPVLYRQRHIRGAKFAGPANKPEGVKSLEALAATLAKEDEVVVYCGCCPMKDCPNIRPAYETLRRLGFKTVRVLNIPHNMHTDWAAQEYPSEPPPVASEKA